MTSKQALLMNIASAGYNIGFGAKKSFASYDTTRLTPKIITFGVIAIGILQLLPMYEASFSANSKALIAALLIIIGIIGMVIDASASSSERYKESGVELISLFNRLRTLYFDVENSQENENLQIYADQLSAIEEQAKEKSVPDQLMFTHMWAHIQFFNTMQIEWVHAQKQFKLKDKFPWIHPETFILYIVILVIIYFAARGMICHHTTAAANTLNFYC